MHQQRDLLISVPWFSRCGQPLPEGFTVPDPDPLRAGRYQAVFWQEMPYKVVSWKEAARHFRSRKWEETGLLSKSLRAGDLLRAGYAPADYNELNTVVVQTVDTAIIPVVTDTVQRLRLPVAIVPEVTKQLIRGLLESQFADVGIYALGVSLLKVYQAGHLPCGWEGNWPDGRLMVM